MGIRMPAERFRLAASLGFGPGDVARVLERPMLREVVPGAFVVIFILCLTSFAVALALGVIGVVAHLSIHNVVDNLFVQGNYLLIGFWLALFDDD